MKEAPISGSTSTCVRIAIGPTYRADMWAALDGKPNLWPAELVRETYGSFATAWQAKADRRILTATEIQALLSPR